MEIVIDHEPELQRFSAKLDNQIAVLEYQLNEQTGQIDFYRTYVPETLRGKGMAEKLVRNGLSWAHEKSYKIDATCCYVRKFLK